MIFTYLLKSGKTGKFYTGISKFPKERLEVHNRGGLKSTQDGRPWKLVYSKEHESYAEARKHERWLKKKNHDYKTKLAG